MKTVKINANNLEFSFSESDIVNPEDCLFVGDTYHHKVRGWLLHDHGVTLCVVFAHSLNDAIDIAVDAEKLERYRVREEDAADYGGDIYNSESVHFLGNAGETFDIETLGYVEFAGPTRSITDQFADEVPALSVHVA